MVFGRTIKKTIVKVILGVNYAVEFKFDTSFVKHPSRDPELTSRIVIFMGNFEAAINEHDSRGNLPRKIQIVYQFIQLTDG